MYFCKVGREERVEVVVASYSGEMEQLLRKVNISIELFNSIIDLGAFDNLFNSIFDYPVESSSVRL